MGQRTLQQFRDDLSRVIGRPDVGQDFLDAKINAAYEEVCGAIEFKRVQCTYDFVTVDGTAVYSAPSDTVGMAGVVDQSNDLRLLRIEIEDYYSYNPDSDNEGEPTKWAFDGENVYLWPTPDEDGIEMLMIYWSYPSRLTSETSTTVLAPTWDMVIHMLAAYNALLDLAKDEVGLARAQMFASRAFGMIKSRKTDRQWGKAARSGGLDVAHSEADLTDQET